MPIIGALRGDCHPISPLFLANGRHLFLICRRWSIAASVIAKGYASFLFIVGCLKGSKYITDNKDGSRFYLLAGGSMISKAEIARKQLRLVVADDHALVRELLETMFKEQADMQVIASAGDTPEAVKAACRLKPDVLILDLEMPGGDPLETITTIKKHCPEVEVVILTAHTDQQCVNQAIKLGASAYVLKDVSKEELLSIIRRVASGEAYLDSRVTRAVIDSLGSEEKQPKITPREKEILWWVAGGLSNKEISRQLTISLETVKTHIDHILRKLEASDRAQAVAIAIREHLID